MTVELRNIGKTVGRGDNRRVLFDDLNLRIAPGDRIAILAPPKSGKSTLLRMICGTDHPDRGVIDRASSVSWPIPLGDFMVPFSTVAANIRFVMRVYGLTDEDLLREIAAIVEITEFLNVRLSACPSRVRPRLAFAIGVGLGFDVCLFDERVAIGDKEFRKQAVEIVKSLSPQKAVVIATSVPKEMTDVCDIAYVLEEGRLTPFSDVKDAVDRFKSLLVKEEDKEPEAADNSPEPVEDEFVLEVGI